MQTQNASRRKEGNNFASLCRCTDFAGGDGVACVVIVAEIIVWTADKLEWH